MHGFSAHVAAKAGIGNLAKSASLKYETEDMRVNAVARGQSRGRSSSGPWTTRSFESRFLSIDSMEGLTQPEEVAAAVTFLRADESSRIIRITLPVDGGYLPVPRT